MTTLQPLIQKPRPPFIARNCKACGEELTASAFTKSKSIYSVDGYLPICNSCIKQHLIENRFDWHYVDKLCMYADIPFIPKDWEEIRKQRGDDAFEVYAQIFFETEYESLNWSDYYSDFKQLQQTNYIVDELPLLREEKFCKLREKWGENYADEELMYLENLFSGLLTTQNVNGALQLDQAKKLCTISLEIDSRIRSGSDFDKLLSSYDKLVKTAEFTPKNTKNASDFDSMGEVVLWLEKRGWVNQYYNDVSQDIVDETLTNIQASNRRFYTNESGIGDDITQRIKSLEKAQELESFYDTDKEYDLETYQDDAWKEIGENEDFVPGGDV